MSYIPKKKVRFNVQCPVNPQHIFEKMSLLEQNQDRPEQETGIDAFCPFCSQVVEAAVIEKTPLDVEILKRFEKQDKARKEREARGGK